MSRTKNVTINLMTSAGTYAVSTVLAFVYRTFFIRELGAVYLGVQGLFTSILSLLSLVELGVGSALTFSMYEPLAKNDQVKTKQLLRFYEKAYRIIAIIVLGIGACFLPFLDFFVKERPNISESLEFIYILYVLNSALSYICIYKQSILQADQKGFVVALFNSLFQVIRTILQIVSLFIFKSFILTLLIQIVCTFAGNLTIFKYAEHKYPYIKNLKNSGRLEEKEQNTIIDKVKALFLYKIGAYIVNGTDSILISKFVGVVENGLYSNYLMLITVVKTLFEYGCHALTPSLGNKQALAREESGESKEEDFLTLLFIHFWFLSIITACFVGFIKPFIMIWAGTEYVLDELTAAFLALNMYMFCMRRVFISYRNAFGLFVYARYKPIAEALINLVASLLLQIKFGLAGIVIGTTVGELLTSFWIEPHVLYKHHFKIKSYKYWRSFTVYTLLTIVYAILTKTVSSHLSINSWYMLVLFAGAAAIILFIINFLIFRKTKEEKAAISRVIFLLKRI